MSDNWQPGDLALHINPRPRFLRTGAVYVVQGVVGPIKWACGDFGPALILQGHIHPENDRNDANGGFWHGQFRKVTPPKADEFDREVIELMCGGKVSA
jgi:hypothetical protein